MKNYHLAKAIGAPAQRIGEMAVGKRAITADTDLRLCRFFGLSDGWRLRRQAVYDIEVAKASLAKIRPWKEAAEQAAGAHRPFAFERKQGGPPRGTPEAPHPGRVERRAPRRAAAMRLSSA